MNEDWKDNFIELIDNMGNDLEQLKKICKDNNINNLYKYRSEADYNITNLLNNELRMAGAIEFNDPFDCEASAVNRDLIVQKYELESYEDFMTEDFKNYICSMIHDEIYPKHEEFIKKIRVCCFSGNKDSILMWSHYANDHKGFCIEYNVNEMLESMLPILPVKYTDEMPLIHDPNRINKRYAPMFTKSTAWSYEDEWRVIFTKDDSETFLKHLVPSAIYIGCNASSKFRTEILSICSNKNIDCYEAVKDFFTYKLNFIKITD